MTKPSILLESFGKLLREKRIEKRIGLREICRTTGLDPSNWSKIERGRLAPPSDEKTLSSLAGALGIKPGSLEHQDFIDAALVAQGIIPRSPNEQEMLKLLPAFFRTIRKEKPTKKELDELMQLLKETL